MDWRFFFFAACVTCAASAQGVASPESGTFVLHKFAKAIGKETYTIKSDDKEQTLTSDFLFTDRGSPVPLKTTYRATAAGEPISLTLTGRSSRLSELKDSLTLDTAAHRVNVLHDGAVKTYPVTGLAMLVDGYSPVAMQQMLMRYWQSHGRPAAIAAPPGGTVHVEPAGPLVVTIAGKPVTLQGYVLSGLIWGVETLWLDETQPRQPQLAALVSTDAEFDHFEAVRERFEPAFATFVQAAARNSLDALGRLAARAKLPVERRLVITHVTLIDGTGAAPRLDQNVFIQDGTIVRIEDFLSQKKSASLDGYQVLDGTGKFLMPGLWDMHAHYEQVEWGPIYLAAGVTTVRDCGNEFDFITTVRDTLNAGKGIGPRLLIAGIVDGPGPQSLGAIVAATPEEAVAVVRRYKAAGALQIKLYSSISPALVPVITAEAHRLGMTVTGHVPDGMDATQAIAAGMDQINHVQYPATDLISLTKGRVVRDDDFSDPAIVKEIALFRDKHIVLDDTLSLFEVIYRPASVPVASFEPGVTHVAPQLAEALNGGGASGKNEERMGQFLKVLRGTVKAMHAAGVTIVAGTDQNVPGYSLHRELELYVELGFTPMEALQAATSVPARVMGLDKLTGTVEAGKQADLLLLDANPLDDIHNTRKVYRTISGGAVYDPAPLWRAVGFTP